MAERRSANGGAHAQAEVAGGIGVGFHQGRSRSGASLGVGDQNRVLAGLADGGRAAAGTGGLTDGEGAAEGIGSIVAKGKQVVYE
ncbi:hypothetical protein GCM10027577_25630 [Spirosoma fluminis]